MTDILIKHLIKNHEDTQNPTVRAAYGRLTGVVGIACNITLFFLKLIIGTLSGSVAITADAVNNLSDATSSIINLLGFKLAERPADAQHPYGHGRYEYLSGLSVAVLIMVIGVELLKSGIDKIINPAKVDFSIWLVAILVFSIILKLWMMFFNKNTGKKIASNALIVTAADSRNDVISTGAVLISAIISHYTSVELDGWIGVGVAVFILISGFGLIREMIDPMLGTAPDESFIKEIKDKIMAYPGVLGIHDLIVHDYGPSRRFASVHVEMAAEEDVIVSHDTIDNIESDFRDTENINLIIHYDPVLTKDPLTKELKMLVAGIIEETYPSFSIHDFRVVPGTTHTNLVFDCVVPFEEKMPDRDIKTAIEKSVKKVREEYNCVITIDRSSLKMD